MSPSDSYLKCTVCGRYALGEISVAALEAAHVPAEVTDGMVVRAREVLKGHVPEGVLRFYSGAMLHDRQ